MVRRLRAERLQHHRVVALCVHFLKDAETDAEVLDVVSLRVLVGHLRVGAQLLPADSGVEPDLEVAATMLLSRVAVTRRYNKVVDDHDLPTSILTV